MTIQILLTYILLALVLPAALMIISSTVAKKTINDREKNSPFECGFDPKDSARTPFSLRFFLIAVIFLIFDVEIVLLLPLLPVIGLAGIKGWVYTSIFILLIILGGLYHEWSQGALDWAE